jgi:hypothetical protein
MDDARRCTARSTRSGERCKKAAMLGATVCRSHGGAAPQARRAAEVRAAQMAAHETAQRMVSRAGVDADPIEHLLDSLHVAAAMCVVWGQMVADLDNAAEVDLQDRPGGLRGEVWWEEQTYLNAKGEEVRRPVAKADRLLAMNREGTLKVHPYVAQYDHWVTERARFAKLCIDAGIAERQTKLAETQAQLIAQAIRGILTDLGVADRPEAPAIVRRHLTLVRAAG